jgi:hypothetical protein
VVLLRKSIPQKTNLQTAAELGVKQGKMDIEQVSEILKKARELFETRGSEIDSVCFGNFPRGACGNSSDIIGKWLSQKGVSGLKYAWGTRGQASHGWLEYKGYILDITSDQFADGCGSVFIWQNSKFHSSFKNQKKSELAISPSLFFAFSRFSELMENA